MSASLVPSQTTTEWLPLPRDVNDSESFSKDLISQFDKRRSRLRVEMGELEKQNGVSNPGRSASVSSSVSNLRNSSGVPPPPLPTAPQQQEETATTTSTTTGRTTLPGENNMAYAQGRRRSAGDLLRRSSAYFKAKLDVFRGSRSHDNLRDSQSAHLPSTSNAFRSFSSKKKQQQQQAPLHHTTRADEIFNASSASLPPPSKIGINTTIAIPQFAIPVQHQPPAHFAAIKPPVITQYPPKPLKYSPVEPISDDFLGRPPHRTIVHRISLPVLRRGGNEHRSSTTRRRSDTDMREPHARRSKASKKKKGKEPATIESPTTA
ncbi:hypothetical protein EC973_007680 [Apophysomyces ossiformis]|uniref:Uncharacterized protein n=1 Tax=Apophysomyces ossiformis TaxID=679940 RepID=A0A8H7ETB7_9FUNG|nr:hypothetical protein EC973_007680 [Apophysomyces ossiformis]